MTTLKFIGNDPQQKNFYSTLRNRVNDYFTAKEISQKGNASLVVKAVAMLSIYIAPFIFLLTTPVNSWVALLLAVVMGIGEAGIGMAVMHDAAHGSFSDKRWVNQLFSSTMFLLGSNTFNWKVQHNILHHTYTNVYGYDQDIGTKAVIRLCDHAPLKKIHRFQHVYAFFLYGLMTLSKLITDFNQLIEFNQWGMTVKQQASPRKEMIKLMVSKVAYVSIVIGLPLWFTDFHWWQVLIGFAVMHLTAGMIMSTVFQMAHVVEGAKQPLPDSEGTIHEEWAVHQLQSTSDFARHNFLLNWYVGGLNFQIEHHLFANISHIHYPRIAPIVEKTAQEFGLVYNLKPTLMAALSSHRRRLKELGGALDQSR
jgi:linoleoyl-CoA desaturase